MTVAPLARAGRDLLDPSTFAAVAARLAEDHPEMAERAAQIVDQALAFLTAAATVPEGGLRPSPLVDLGWHQLILDTRLYADLCDRLAGQFLHHVPDDGSGEGGASTGEVARTVEAIRAAGYVVDMELWPRAAKCGQCHEEGNCSNSGSDGNENTDSRSKGPR
ncbi:glycine-rich domain-containing protein [Actinokineospora sp. NPDC004072]